MAETRIEPGSLDALRIERGRMADPVIKPEHYQAGGIETIDVIRAKLGPVGFGYYCEGNVLKYLTRWRHKGGVEDLRKAAVYLEWLLTEAQLQHSHGLLDAMTADSQARGEYEERAVIPPNPLPVGNAHHATDAPMPPYVEEVIAAAFEGDEEPGALKAGEAFREHADGAL